MKTSKRLAMVLLFLTGGLGPAGAQTFTTLYQFGGFPTDSARSSATLVQGRDGSLYGTTINGGTNGLGTVFKITTNGALTTLYYFTGNPDGSGPENGLVLGSDGIFYGTTTGGGGISLGGLFKITTNGVETMLHNFIDAPDGGVPKAGLIQGTDGNFYGTTYHGGVPHNCNGGCGTVFKMTSDGTVTILYIFGGGADGQRPQGGVVQGVDGNFYGTTIAGGANSDGNVFKITSDGTLTSLYSFGGTNDGAFPQAGLVQGADGNFYGTTDETVFKITPSGTLTALHSFTNSTDGNHLFAPLVQGSDGNFYGTTTSGGTNFLYGTLFRITPSGTFTVLHTFNSGKDGSVPYGGLMQGRDGSFYGTTLEGGTNNVGTVFKLTVPLVPPPWPINQITGIQSASTSTVFSIPSIAGETYQLQFSTSMHPTNWVNVPTVSLTNSIGALLTLTNSAAPQGFYRFAITP